MELLHNSINVFNMTKQWAHKIFKPWESLRRWRWEWRAPDPWSVHAWWLLAPPWRWAAAQRWLDHSGRWCPLDLRALLVAGMLKSTWSMWIVCSMEQVWHGNYANSMASYQDAASKKRGQAFVVARQESKYLNTHETREFHLTSRESAMGKKWCMVVTAGTRSRKYARLAKR